MKHTIALALGLTVLGAPAFALDCIETTIQSEMNACAQIEYENADEDLNSTYQYLMSHFRELDLIFNDGTSNAVESFKNAQRAWIPYRDAHCASVAYEFDGGSAYPMVYYYCLADATYRRTEEMRAAFEQN